MYKRQVHDGATGGGLTATGLTDQAERLASTNLEGKVVDSGDDLLGASVDVSLGLGLGGVEAGALEHDVDVEEMCIRDR